MRYFTLGRDPSIRVSAIALGTMSVAAGTMHSGVDEERAIDTIRAALEAGVNFIDTAPAYGNGESEERVGRAVAEGSIARETIVFATKASGKTLSASEIAADCEASLRRLRTTYIDLYQIHWRQRVVPLSETLDAMRKLKQQGKVRAIGVCNFGPGDLADADESSADLVSNQVAYSLLSRGPELGLVEACVERGMGILCYSPLAQGLLTGKYRSADKMPADRCRSRHFAGTRPNSRHGEAGCEPALFEAVDAIDRIALELGLSMSDLSVAWLLHQRCVASVLCGASTPEQARDNVRAAEITLSADVVARLDAATESVKAHMGSNLDLWQGAGNSRIH